MRYLHREGMPVSVPIPTTDGRHFVDGLVVMTYVEGGPPETEADWRRVADTLRKLHRNEARTETRPGPPTGLGLTDDCAVSPLTASRNMASTGLCRL